MKKLITILTALVAVFSLQAQPLTETRKVVEVGTLIRVFPNTLQWPMYFQSADKAWVLSDADIDQLADMAIENDWSKEHLIRWMRPFDKSRWHLVWQKVYGTTDFPEVAYPAEPGNLRLSPIPNPRNRFEDQVWDPSFPKPEVYAVEKRKVVNREDQTYFGITLKGGWQCWELDDAAIEHLTEEAYKHNWSASDLNRALRAYDTSAVPEARRIIESR